MPWLTTKKPSTLELVRAEHRPQASRKRYHWPLLALLAASAIAWLLFLRHEAQLAHAQQLAGLAAENRTLQTALDDSRLQLREAQAAQEQLLRRIDTMSAQAKTLKTELAFFKKQKNGN